MKRQNCAAPAAGQAPASGVLPAIDVREREVRHATERPTAAFRRSIPLPAGVDPNTVTAESRHGVLIVMVAKTEREKARKIPIRSQPANAGQML